MDVNLDVHYSLHVFMLIFLVAGRLELIWFCNERVFLPVRKMEGIKEFLISSDRFSNAFE